MSKPASPPPADEVSRRVIGMSPRKILPRTPSPVQLRDFRKRSLRLLPSDHPFRPILESLPDEMDVRELDLRLGDWLTILGWV